MAANSVDQLTIEINAQAANAKSAVGSLADSLSAAATKANSAVTAFRGISSALSSLSSSTGSANSVTALANACKQFSDVRISKTIGNNLAQTAAAANQIGDSSNLDGLASGIVRLNGVKVSASIPNQLKNISEMLPSLEASVTDSTISKLEQVATAFNTLASIPKSNLGTSINALKKLPEAVAAIESVDLTRFQQQCTQISNALGNLPQKMSSVARGFGAIKAMAQATGTTIASSFKQAESKAEAFRKALTKVAGVITSLNVLKNVLQRVANIFAGFIETSNNYIEDMNLANTSLGEYAEEAQAYANQVNEILTIDTGSWMRNQGIFMSMAAGMGVATSKAYTMSQGFTQLGYDLASFFNLDTEEAFQKLQSGLSGEIEPLRRLGFDLTEARLSQEALNLGIEKSVSDMTQAEKAMLRYNAILNQVTWSQGDMAKTISSPANMLRVFSDNITQASRAIGNIFLPMLQAILPVAIAVSRVVATLANMLADLTGGNQIAAIEYGSGDSGTSSIEAAGDAAEETGNQASDAADKVKELKRQLMGFDEINMFTSSSSNSGSGSGSSGSGSGDSGTSDIPVQSYDFLGNGAGLGDDIYNALMEAVKRAGNAFAPLVTAAKVTCQAIAEQFRGLDIGGAMENALMGALNLISNAVRNVIEVVGPLVVAFNFPETIALAFDAAGQLCLTLSAAINDVGSTIKGFTDTALIQLVSWIGDKLRDALKFTVDLLASWQDWFQNALVPLNKLGQIAGDAATIVFHLAEALAEPIFATCAATFRGISDALQPLLTALINSGAAKVAAAALGTALATWAVGNSISTGLGIIGDAFSALCGKLQTHSNNAATSAQHLADTAQTTVPKGLDAFKQGIQNLSDKFPMAMGNVDKMTTKTKELASAIDPAKTKLSEERSKLSDLETSLAGSTTKLTKLKIAHQESKVSVADWNVKLTESKAKLSSLKTTLTNHVQTEGAFNKSTLECVKSIKSETGEVVKNTAGKVAATTQSGLMAAAEGVATVASGALATAMNLIPGLALATALGAVLSVIEPLIEAFVQAAASPIVNFVQGLLGIDDATGDVTDTTEEATAVLSEEEQQIQDNVESIQKYEQSHNNLKTALAASRMSEESFATFLQQTGTTFSEVSNKIDSYTTDVVNSFDKIETESEMTADEMMSNLESNIQTLNSFHQNMQTIMQRTGLDSTDSLISAMLSAGPSKCGQAAAQLANATDAELDRFKTIGAQAGADATNNIVAELLSGSSDAQAAGNTLMSNVATGVTSGGETVKSTAGDVDDQTVAKFGSHYNEAKDAGRNLTGGFGDGIAATDMVQLAVTKAQDACAKAVAGFNGGTGYQQALSAGRNLVGGYGDGIGQASASAVAKASSVTTSVIQSLNGGNGYNKAKSAGSNLVGGYGDGINNAASNAASKAKSAQDKVITALKSNTSSASSAGRTIMTNFTSGISNQTSTAKSAATRVSTSVQQALSSNTSSAQSAGRSIATNFASGITSNSSSVRSAASSLNTTANSAMGNNSQAYSAGRNFGAGFNSGLWSYSSTIMSTARSLANLASLTIRASLRIHSPSRVTAEYGKFFDLGFAQGIEDYTKDVGKSVSAMTAEALDATDVAANMGAQIGSSFSGGISSSLDSSSFEDIATYAKTIGSQASWAGWDNSSRASVSHASMAMSTDDSHMSEVMGAAFAKAMLSVNSATSSTNTTGDTTVVLRVGNEELARATMKGQASLARRGVLEMG